MRHIIAIVNIYKQIPIPKLQITNKALPYGHIGTPLRWEAHRGSIVACGRSQRRVEGEKE